MEPKSINLRQMQTELAVESQTLTEMIPPTRSDNSSGHLSSPFPQLSSPTSSYYVCFLLNKAAKLEEQKQGRIVEILNNENKGNTF